MNKKLAVLLLRIDGAPDLPSKDYADQLFTNAGKGTRNLVDYYQEMSHGRLDIGQSQVFDWIDYGHTIQDIADEWTKAKNEKLDELKKAGKSDAEAEDPANIYANGIRRDKIKEWGVDAAVKNNLVLNGFDIKVFIFNQSVDYFGSYGEVVLNWNDSANHASFSIDLTGVSHEVGHGLGLEHSRLENSNKEYGDRWDIMTAYDSIYLDRTGTLTPPGSPYFTFGPGLNAVNMELVGWLDVTRVFTGKGSASFNLRPLHRRELPGWLAAKLQIGLETIFIEFRMNELWDVQIPGPCILLHRKTNHPENGRLCSEIIVAKPGAMGSPQTEMYEGDIFEMGDAADPFGFFAQIKVTRIDAQTREASLYVYVRERRQVEPSGTLYGGVTSDGGGLVWTPGRGFVKVPPRSPLLLVLEMITEVETLQTINPHGRRELIEELTLHQLSIVHEHLGGIIAARKLPHVPAPLNIRQTGDSGVDQ